MLFLYIDIWKDRSRSREFLTSSSLMVSRICPPSLSFLHPYCLPPPSRHASILFSRLLFYPFLSFSVCSSVSTSLPLSLSIGGYDGGVVGLAKEKRFLTPSLAPHPPPLWEEHLYSPQHQPLQWPLPQW